MLQAQYLRFIFIILVVSLIDGKVFAQSILKQSLTIEQSQGSSIDLLHAIESELDVTFSYSNKVCLKDNIQLSSNTNTLIGFLNEIFKTCPVDIKVRNKKVFIIPLVINKPNKFVISGHVKNRDDGEVLIGASIYESKLWVGSVSNNFGFYSITLPEGDVVLNSSFVGYRLLQKRFKLTKDTTINFDLEFIPSLQEVPVVAFHSSSGINTTRTSTINVPVEQIKNVPSFLGEVDVIKTLQLLPGINSGNEGLSGLFVRGGSSDQNLYLLDDVPVYNISHLFGFFSVFNADALNNVTIMKGGFSARYGGRLSSVIDVRLKDGNKEKIKGTASLGMMSSKLALDGPLFNDKTTFSLSLRRSYFDLFAIPMQSNKNSKDAFFFYDASLKLSHQFSSRSRIYLSYYGGKDRYYTRYNSKEVRNPNQQSGGDETIKVYDENYSGWGNQVASLRWNKIFSDKVFSNFSLAYSQYKYFVGYEENNINSDVWGYFEQKYNSGITDLLLKIDFDYYMNPYHHLRYGGSHVYHSFNPGVDFIRRTQNVETEIDSTFGGDKIRGHELYFYLEDDFELIHNLKVNAGIHMSYYFIPHKIYNSLQPRISARYLAWSKIAFKMAYSRMTQYMHLAGSSYVSLPTDLWIPVTENVKPQHADQFSLGVNWELKKGFDISIDAYYKKYSQLLAYWDNDNSTKNSFKNLEKSPYGKGHAKGIELLLHKKTGKLSGWVGYTLAKAMQSFKEINDGNEFPMRNDRRHEIGIYANYKFNSKVDVSATWSLGSGNAITLPSQKYYRPQLPTQAGVTNSSYSEHISAINGYRMPEFHRLDVGVNFKRKIRWGERVWSLGVFNAYGRQNAFSLYFNDEINQITGEQERQLRQLSLFPFPLPYIRYTLRF